MTLKPPRDQDFIVIGATGDLAQRKLLPALYNLHAEGLLPRSCAIVGLAPDVSNEAAFRALAETAIKDHSRTGIDASAFASFRERLRFLQLSADDDLRPVVDVSTNERRLFYLAVPPSAFETLITGIGNAGLAATASIIIEKPFGRDTASAHELNELLHRVVPEERIFRIDHYLGKETVQNLLTFRFGNSMFERVWNRDAVAQVEISVAETLGVEKRGRLYEELGAIRDIVQNHIFQVLALVGMDPPITFDAEALRNEKAKVLRSIRPITPAHVVRGQYTEGTVNGQCVSAYRSEPGVAAKSTTETFAALRVHLDSWRWARVPFYLRTGKRLRAQDSRILVLFRETPLHLFREAGMHQLDSNMLCIRIQPDEGISLRFVAKQPGPEMRTQPVEMNFKYGDSFKSSPPEAYERLLHDALDGDHTLFIREDEVELGWEALEQVLASPPPITFYEAGSWGPKEADATRSPGHWHDPVPDP